MTATRAVHLPRRVAGLAGARDETLQQRVDSEFRAFVADTRFPCLAAKGAMRRGGYQLRVYDLLASAQATAALGADLVVFAQQAPRNSRRLTAFVAVFVGRPPSTERVFERRLWMQLQRLHERDDPATGWDPAVSADPDDPRFAFSFAGRAFFVVGLHPRSSRLARRFRWPALVFNPHEQFERLRRQGVYDRLKSLIRARDLAVQGTLNPNLADFGERSEARQYSGRATTADEWRCPFHRRTP